MIIKGIPDRWEISPKKKLDVLSKNWLNSVSFDLKNINSDSDKRITIDLSNIDFVSAYEWVSLVALVNYTIDRKEIDYVDIDLIGDSKEMLLKPKEYMRYIGNRDFSRTTSPSDFYHSHRAYQIVGFLEAFGTKSALFKSQKNVSILYPWLNLNDADFLNFYEYKETRPTVFLGLTEIRTEENCRLFLEDEMVMNWRNAMREKFDNSPILETEEIWRSICHELSTNIWEHSNSSGYIFYRVVKPVGKNNKIRWWCKNNYSETLGNLWGKYKDGFLEICAVDSGDGFVNSLKESYLNQSNRKSCGLSDVVDILSFAFDEFGTSKTKDESWVLSRHALGRILLIVSKYGGVITLRSDGVEIRYISSEKGFLRNKNGMGYKPSSVDYIDENIVGSHIQILLPLYPTVSYKDFVERESVFNYLPKSYTIDPNHVRGHLVPVMESLGFKNVVRGTKNIRKFRNACIRLNNSLRDQHPPSEPLIFDFSAINWEPAQFETFLYLLQNIIQKRLVLLVEIDSRLAKEVIKLEADLSDTFIDKKVLGHSSEKKFFETYTAINNIVLGIDKNGEKYLFGLSDHKYEKALLGLIETPDTISGLCSFINGSKENEAFCKTILTRESSLFYLDKLNRWNCSWNSEEILLQANRIISDHFDQIANATGAWQGRSLSYSDHIDELDDSKIIKKHFHAKLKYNLPWQEEWRDAFLESSKILSRERYCDEAAHRLIYRLKYGLEKLHRKLDDVNVFVCVTGPALLLASAMYRWWPDVKRPIVADLSYNVLLESSESLPSIVDEGGIVIVQDIFERRKVSGELLRKLQNQSKDILCAISLIKLRKNVIKTKIIPVSEGWADRRSPRSDRLPYHSLIEAPSPSVCEPPNENDDDSNLFWIEPRSLHPTSYRHLRREFGEGRDPYLRRRDEILPEFDSKTNGCLFAAGHYVYGHRHYQVAIDVKKLISGKIGKLISNWIADVCEGNPMRNQAAWERDRGYRLKGDVTFIIMPLHSQIHYLWPEIRNVLAQRGRRVIMCLLDATLFSGRRPTYRISHHLEQQLKRASLDAIEACKAKLDDHPSPLRLFIIDDAIASARSAETILLSISNRLNKIFRKANFNLDKLPNKYHPIQWIRYFAILNQMGHANHTLWHNMKHIGTPPINFILEEYAPFMGVPLYEKKDCPYCNDRARLKQLIANCSQFGANMTVEWVNESYRELKPIAIDGPTFGRKEPTPIDSGIDILGLRSKRMGAHPIKYITKFADTAIWRFHKLMHLSYPIEDILRNINKWWEFNIAKKENYDESQKIEYQRYRWAVIDWCIKNWSRVKASTARKSFVDLIDRELKNNTPLIEKFLNGCHFIYTDKYIFDLLKKMIFELERLEFQRKEENKVIDKERIERIDRIETGLTIFFLNIVGINDEGQSTNNLEGINDSSKELLNELENSTKRLSKIGTNLINNLYTRLIRPKSIASPKWALNAVAENLFRGRDPKNAPAGRHHLLPRVLYDNFSKKRNIEDLLLLEGSLSVFLAALKDILPYAYLSSPFGDMSSITPDAENVKDLSEKILNWIKINTREKLLKDRPPELTVLYDSLSLDGKFVQAFNAIFQVDINYIKNYIENTKAERPFSAELDFKFISSPGTGNSTVLCYINSLLNILMNHAVDPMDKMSKNHKSKIEVSKPNRNEFHTDRMVFRIATNFDSLDITNQKIFDSKRGLRELKNIEIFGAKFHSREWFKPNQEEIEDGYTAAWEIMIPTGYLSKKD